MSLRKFKKFQTLNEAEGMDLKRWDLEASKKFFKSVKESFDNFVKEASEEVKDLEDDGMGLHDIIDLKDQWLEMSDEEREDVVKALFFTQF